MQTSKITAALEADDAPRLIALLGQLTAHQIAQYILNIDEELGTWIWVECPVTWGFEVWWGELTITGEEQSELPENFDPHVKLDEIQLWALQDQATRA